MLFQPPPYSRSHPPTILTVAGLPVLCAPPTAATTTTTTTTAKLLVRRRLPRDLSAVPSWSRPVDVIDGERPDLKLPLLVPAHAEGRVSTGRELSHGATAFLLVLLLLQRRLFEPAGRPRLECAGGRVEPAV